jgi:hypothetical protein
LECFFEAFETAVERLVEARFFLFERLADDILTVFQLGEHSAHLGDKCCHQRAEERLFSGETELAAIPNGAAEQPLFPPPPVRSPALSTAFIPKAIP